MIFNQKMKTMKAKKFSLMVFTLALCLGFVSCNQDNDDNPITADPDIQLVQHSTYGTILADEQGLTLYFFSEDVTGESKCAGGCLANWPVFYVANPSYGAGVESDRFGVITRADGSKQTTFDGWPLYYYTPDQAQGEAKGEGAGNKWFVAKQDYTVMYGLAQLIGADGKSYKEDYTEGTAMTSYLTDAEGRTLYGFVADTRNKNNYTDADFGNDAVWPVYIVDELKEIPSILSQGEFSIIDVHGKKQLTYKGWPLYYYGGDAGQRGVNKGVSVPQPGVWPVLNKNSASL